MTTYPDGHTHYLGCACNEARRDAELGAEHQAAVDMFSKWDETNDKLATVTAECAVLKERIKELERVHKD